MAGVPPPYTQNDQGDPSAPIHGGYQQVPAKPQYGSIQTTPASSAPSQPPPRTSTHNTAVVTQEPRRKRRHSGMKPENHMTASILNMLFCFFILGLIALIFSFKVDSAWAAGNELEAQRNSKIANILNKVGMGVGIATYVMVIIWIIVYSAIGVLRARSSLNT